MGIERDTNATQHCIYLQFRTFFSILHLCTYPKSIDKTKAAILRAQPLRGSGKRQFKTCPPSIQLRTSIFKMNGQKNITRHHQRELLRPVPPVEIRPERVPVRQLRRLPQLPPRLVLVRPLPLPHRCKVGVPFEEM